MNEEPKDGGAPVEPIKHTPTLTETAAWRRRCWEREVQFQADIGAKFIQAAIETGGGPDTRLRGELHTTLGHCLVAKGDYQGAVDAFKKAIEIKKKFELSSHACDCFFLAWILPKLGRHKEAREMEEEHKHMLQVNLGYRTWEMYQEHLDTQASG